MTKEDEYVEEFIIIDKKTDQLRKLNPADPADAELIQEHKDAIRHGHGIVFDLDKKEKPH